MTLKTCRRGEERVSHVYIQEWAFQLEGISSTKALSWIPDWSVWTEWRRVGGMDQKEVEGVGVAAGYVESNKSHAWMNSPPWKLHLSWDLLGMVLKSYSVIPQMGILVIGKEMLLGIFYWWVELVLQRPNWMSGPRKEERGFWSENTKGLVPLSRGHTSDGVPLLHAPSSFVLLWLAGGLGFPNRLCKADTHQYYSKWVDSK